ncbi:uncharacterized protein C11orf97 homolog [Cyrtonyx montezumae]|uniref:uncharacterized protein C11orf97 homolog n=1 Tax=Cyrtonyx montezumae TaxID=9017 RepID=UPI0032DAC4D9
MEAGGGRQQAGAAEEADGGGRSETAGGGQPRKNFLYVEPPKRVKEILEEELCFWKEECHIRHPAAVALEGIWSERKNFSIRGLQPASQNRNVLLLQPQFYSRHVLMKSKSQQ